MACSLSTAVLVRVLLAMQRCMVSRRCFRAVDSMSDEEPTLLAIAEEAKLQSVPGDRFGKAPGTAHHPCAPGPHVDGLACDCLRMRLSTVRLLWGDVSRRGSAPPPSLENRGRPNGSQRAWRARKTVAFRRPKTSANTVSRWWSIACHPQRGGTRSATSRRARSCAHAVPPAHLHARSPPRPAQDGGAATRAEAPLAGQGPFFHALLIVVGLTGHTRAGARMPRAFMARSTLGCLTAAVCPAELYTSHTGRPRPPQHTRHR
jgi:hypothetical protein